MKVDVVSRKLIKPWTPTPSSLRTYNISIIDELNPTMHVIRILYYSSSNVINDKKLSSLVESLAKILPLFYPLAGRYIKGKHLVDCNDEGAEFAEAQVDCDLHQLIISTSSKVDISEQLNNLLPVGVGEADKLTDPMLAVQINKFQCGGVAIGVCASHRIFDSASLGIFLQAWANAAVGGDLDSIRPDFDSPSFFPSENVPPLDFEVSRNHNKTIVSRRFVFDKNAISRLREGFHPSLKNPRPPSRMVVVSAFLTQALLRADRAKHGRSRASLISQSINVRERTVPPIPKYACGTWVSLSYLEHTASETLRLENDFPGMVSRMREATIQGVKDCTRILSDKEFGRWVLLDSYFETAKKSYSPDYKVIWITDWSKFGDYELDFGFGKPVWVSLADVPLEDLFILMNTKENDGIEAWIYLHESDMPYFEQDDHLKLHVHNEVEKI